MDRALLLPVALALAACRTSSAAPAASRASGPAATEALQLQAMGGSWRWVHSGAADATYRLERERWLFGRPGIDPATGRGIVDGRYRRDVAILAQDGRPFLCNQRTGYVQTAVFEVRVSIVDRELVVEERGYRTLAGPCEPGFRKLATYRATLARPNIALRWTGGVQTLEPMPPGSYTLDDLELPILPAEPRARITGPWHWSMRSRDDDNNFRDEDESWDLAVAADGTAGGTYVREVLVTSSDGKNLPCAGRPSYRFVDRYTLRGKLVGEDLSLEEVAVDPGAHPCLAATPKRHLDTATGLTVGEHLVLTWRGKRRQVLHRERI